jgi:hypothetical protein
MKRLIVVLSSVATLMLGVLVAGTGYANMSENSVMKLSEKGYEQRSERDLAGLPRPKRAE